MTMNFTRRRYDTFELTEPMLNGSNLTFSYSVIDLFTGSQVELTCKDKICSVVNILFDSVQRLPGM